MERRMEPRRRIDRKTDGERRSYPDLAFNMDFPVVVFDNVIADHQAESVSVLFGGIKRRTDLLQLFFRNPAPLVDKADNGKLLFFLTWIRSFPPPGIASIAFFIRLMNTCFI